MFQQITELWGLNTVALVKTDVFRLRRVGRPTIPAGVQLS